jgi:hypothetical protein
MPFTVRSAAAPVAETAAAPPTRTRRRWPWPVAAALVSVLALSACGLPNPATGLPHLAVPRPTVPVPPVTVPATVPAGLGPITSPPLPPPGPGFLPGVVTAIGDSVMLDAEGALQQDIPGVQINADVSRQWSAGETVLSQLKASGFLGAVVVIDLGTNGPISAADFAEMMAILDGASRVVFVTVHVDQPWQDPVNEVLRAGVTSYPRTVLADWEGLAASNPGWFGADGTHLPIDGTGAQALAALIARNV